MSCEHLHVLVRQSSINTCLSIHTHFLSFLNVDVTAPNREDRFSYHVLRTEALSDGYMVNMHVADVDSDGLVHICI